MALSQSVRVALEDLATEIEVAATWHSGPRYNRLCVLAAQARGIADGSVDSQDVEAVSSAPAAALGAPASTEGDKTRKT